MNKNIFTLFYHDKIQLSCYLCLMALLFTGCATPSGIKLNTQNVMTLNKEAKASTNRAYIIGPGDTISIRFPYSPEWNNDRVTVSPDGNIAMPLIGSVYVQGQTIFQLNTLLTEKYYKALEYSLENYTLGVGDRISIQLLYNNELNRNVQIRPDGKISLPLIKEIHASGITPGALEKLITNRYAHRLDSEEHPEVTVIVEDFNLPELSVLLVESASQIAYVGGAVVQPKEISITGSTSLLAAITMAGGTNNNAALGNIVLLRHDNLSASSSHLMDMNKILSGELPDVILKPYDIVYVPQTSMAKASIYMQQIWRILPTSFIFSFPYNLNTDTNINYSK